MKHAFRWVISLLFIIQMYLAMVVFAVVFLIPMLLHPRGAFWACHSYCKYVLWTARWMVGLRVEIRGDVPIDAVMVAAKHQSFLDIIVIFGAMPRPRFIMKNELLYAPILGQYAYRLGCIPVKRGKRAQAVKKMVADVQAGRQEQGQLVIYPQGTRVAPGERLSYKIGTAVLYQEMGQPCVPVAVNVGLYWPRKGIMRHPGTAVVEFLPRIPVGLSAEDFMEQMENAIEVNSIRLMGEAGFENG